MSMISKYQITWVEIVADNGIVTVKDRKKLGDILLLGKKKALYRHFPNKHAALDWLSGLSAKLSKTYKARLFTDAQFGQRNAADGYKVHFTAKQYNEVYTLG